MKTIGKLVLVIATWLSVAGITKAQTLENCWGCDEEQKQTKYLKYLAEVEESNYARSLMRDLQRDTDRRQAEEDRRWDQDQRQRAIRDYLNDSDLDSEDE